MKGPFYTAILPLFFIISPEGLVLTGNSIGQSQKLYFVAVFMALVLSLSTLKLLLHPELRRQQNKPLPITYQSYWRLPATALMLSSLSIIVILPTGVLVTAGFTFNETFIQWFPNFGFSILLLITVLFLHLAGSRYINIFQYFFITLCLAALLLVIGSGIFKLPSPQSLPISGAPSLSSVFSSTCTVLLLFSIQFTQLDAFDRPTFSRGLIGGCVFLLLWGVVSIAHVPYEKLAESTIPYILVSREVLNQQGRLLIGVAIICGTGALVNGLYSIGTRQLIALTTVHLAVACKQKPLLQRLYPLLFTLFIATFLATGLAGSEFINTYIYGGLLLWMLSLGFYCFMATIQLQKQKNRLLPHYLCITLLYPTATIYLVAVHPLNVRLMGFCLLIFSVCLICSIGLHLLEKKPPPGNPSYEKGEIS